MAQKVVVKFHDKVIYTGEVVKYDGSLYKRAVRIETATERPEDIGKILIFETASARMVVEPIEDGDEV